MSSSLNAMISLPPFIARLDRMTALSPNSLRTMLSASREFFPKNRFMFMLNLQ